MARSLSELAARVGGQIDGDGSLMIDSLAALEEARAGQLSFFSHGKYKRAFASTQASAVLVPSDVHNAIEHVTKMTIASTAAELTMLGPKGPFPIGDPEAFKAEIREFEGLS